MHCCTGSCSEHGSLPGDPQSVVTPTLLSLQQEPSEAPTPKRPRGRPKGSKNKATPKGRVGGWGRGLLRPSSRALGRQVRFELNYRQFRANLLLGWGGVGGVSVLAPKEGGVGGQGLRVSACGHAQ